MERHHELKYDSGYSEAHERAQNSHLAPSSGTGNLDGNRRSNPTPRFPH